ncbi:hypothetical protein B0A54_14543 [Friedmanniomyces endolithicus]|uniref:Cation efflux protein cytoplasmic domain-containing protein n=1 Tax=Friedmanniomyces endolithicus TaxID=329885 RepID=A0A4U0U9L4_9PEZI|nr:hypothetical protein B0A54_14543 [Friedmanniomyces endolithicus]
MTSPQDADLHHAISLRPHPFHQNPPPASTQNATSHSYLPVLGPESHQSPAVPTTEKPGHTSAVETMSTADEPARQRPVFQSRDSIDEGDVERGNSLPDYNDANDPYSLRHGLKTEEDLEIIKANSGKKRSMVTCGIGRDPVAAYKAHKLQGFYEQQNENIERLLKPVDEHVRQAREEREAEGLQYKIAVTGSFIANLILAALQIYAAASSKSLSLFTTMADAIFDPCSQIRILWEDHRNDLFINGVGLLTSVGGSKLRWWIDPMGAIILSVLISFLWMRTAWSEFKLLVGVSADADFLRFVTYVSMTHSPLIVSLDTVRAWHSGPRLIVEVDVVVAPAMSVQESHDVAEALQVKLESLPDVERCYVHIDYETSHAPEHFTKKEL